MAASRRAGNVVAPGFLHLGGDLAANGNLQIGRGEAQAGLRCFQQCVGKDGQRRTCADDILDPLQTVEEGFFGDCELHVLD